MCLAEIIPDKVLKENYDLLLPCLSNNYNSSIFKGYFPNELKSADVSSLFEESDPFNVKNCRPITVLSAAYKIFERLRYDLVVAFVECFLSHLLCGIHKGYNTQPFASKIPRTL